MTATQRSLLSSEVAKILKESIYEPAEDIAAELDAPLEEIEDILENDILQKIRILRMYRENRMLQPKDIASRLNVTPQYVSEVLRDGNVDSLKRKRSLHQIKKERMQEQVRRYFDQGLLAQDVAKKLGITMPTLRALTKNMKDVSFSQSRTRLRERKREFIISSIKDGLSVAIIALELGMHEQSVRNEIQWARKEGLLPPSDFRKNTEEKANHPQSEQDANELDN